MIGVVIPVLNNFDQMNYLVATMKSSHDLDVQIQRQDIDQKPLSAAWNFGIQTCIDNGCEYIAVLNDDLILSPTCLDRMVELFEKGPDNVVLTSAINVFDRYDNPRDILRHNDPEIPDNPEIADHPHYACFMIKRDFFDKVGTFDENFTPAWWEDNDSHYRIHLLGYRAICSEYATCVHYGAQTIKNEPWRNNTSRSEEYFELKWGSKNRDLNEKFKNPYNNSELSPKIWLPNMG